MSIKLLVGLGNPGAEYDKTRHNAGAWFVERIAEDCGVTLKKDSKFFGLHGEAPIGTYNCRLLLPTTFMNHSGQAVAAICRFYKIAPAEILVAHDELDFPAGKIKLKTGGGHGGHNGLRDIISALGGQKQFHRLRVGIGHPGRPDAVLNYVLGRPANADKTAIMQSIDQAISQLPTIVSGDIAAAMNQLNGNAI